MITRAVRIRLLIFVVIAAVAVVNAGVRYARITDGWFADRHQITVELAESGGLFEAAEVTYRGVTIGRVEDLTFQTDGVLATIQIDAEYEIPMDLDAEVHNRSAVGEQYLDLVPRTASAPYLADGVTIPREQTSTPTDEQTFIVATNRLLESVNTKALGTLLDETESTFAGTTRGQTDLGRLIDGSSALVTQLNQQRAATIGLLRAASPVLATQLRLDDATVTWVNSLATVSAVFARADDSVRAILRDGAPATEQTRALFNELRPVLPAFLSGLGRLSQLTSDRVAGLEEGLIAMTFALASAITPGRNGRAHFTAITANAPGPCTDGYIPPSGWRSPHDSTHTVLPDDIGCTEPLTSVPRGANSVHPDR